MTAFLLTEVCLSIERLLRPLVELKFFSIRILLLLLYGGAGGVDKAKDVDNCKRKAE